MAHTTLSVLSSTHFPEVCAGFLDLEIRRVTEIYDALMPVCAWESPESSHGAGDGGYPCGAKATVVNLASEQPMCVKHFAAVNRG